MALLEKAEAELEAAGFQVPEAAAWQAKLGASGAEVLALGYFLGRLVRVSQELTYTAEQLEKLRGLLDTWFATHAALTVADFRSFTDASRKYAVPLLEHCDRLFKLYRNERNYEAKRLPSEAFYEQCAISFESDEVQTMRQWEAFENIGIWASDAYHHDGADSWSAIREMQGVGVPEEVQAKLMGGNARRLYGIEPKTFITEEPDPIDRPDWFPGGPELDEWARLVAHPRRNAEALAEMNDSNEEQFIRTARQFSRAAARSGY
jgi:hypothetical protein